MANLAAGFGGASFSDMAEELGKQVLDVRMEVLGENHPDTIASMSSLAMIYRSQARREEAADLMVAAIQKGSNQLGKEHPSTLINIYNMALIRLEQGHWGIAQDARNSILGKMETVLGRQHECTVRCGQYLA
jgi:hypothetical protein